MVPFFFPPAKFLCPSPFKRVLSAFGTVWCKSAKNILPNYFWISAGPLQNYCLYLQCQCLALACSACLTKTFGATSKTFSKKTRVDGGRRNKHIFFFFYFFFVLLILRIFTNRYQLPLFERICWFFSSHPPLEFDRICCEKTFFF